MVVDGWSGWMGGWMEVGGGGWMGMDGWMMGWWVGGWWVVVEVVVGEVDGVEWMMSGWRWMMEWMRSE